MITYRHISLRNHNICRPADEDTHQQRGVTDEYSDAILNIVMHHAAPVDELDPRKEGVYPFLCAWLGNFHGYQLRQERPGGYQVNVLTING